MDDEVADGSGEGRSESEGGSPYDPLRDDEESGAKEYDTTKSWRLHPSTTAESQKSAARRGDPNHGCCLLTREQLAVQVCHLLPRAVKDHQLDRLEWVWGMKHHSLNVDTSKNLLFLRADWYISFDDDNWLLIPDADFVQNMYNRLAEFKNGSIQPQDIQQLYNGRGEEVFEYRLVATEKLKNNVLFRQQPPDEIPATNVVPSNPPYTYHQYPFKSLGVLESHVQPHFVLVNAGKKLDKMERPLVLAQTAAEVLSNENALTLLIQILEIYRVWTRIQVPSEFCRFSGRSERRRPPKDERDSDEESPSEQRRRRSKRSRKSHADGKKSLEGAAPPNVRHRMLLPVTDDPPCLEDDGTRTKSITSPMEGRCSTYRDDSGRMLDESLLSWAEKCSQEATSEGGWEASVFNDEQIGYYRTERARVPREESWRTWRAPWIRRNYDIHPPQTHKFSSNDWAVYHECRYLTD